MFKHIDSTIYAPKDKPMMVYDGNCGFCKYWVIRWKMMSNNQIVFEPYQKVSKNYLDVDEVNFKEAVRLIDIDGKIYSGPGAAYITYFKREKVKYLFRWYQNVKWFRNLNDLLYQFVADNRSLMYKVCIKLLGKNPRETKHYWIFYFIGIICFFTLICFLLTNT